MKKEFYQYSCFECKKRIEEIGKAFVLDDKHRETFCSSECAVIFHEPMIEFFEKTEQNYRLKNNIRESDLDKGIDLSAVLKDTVDNYDFHYQDLTSREEEIHYLHKKVPGSDTLNLVVVAKFLYQEVSFVYHYFLTHDEGLSLLFSRGEKIAKPAAETGEGFERYFQEEIDLMRSEYLGEILNLQNDDIPFEQYHEYETQKIETFSQADERYSFKDDSGREVSVNIKAYDNYFYFVLFFHEVYQGEMVGCPVLSLPSREEDIYLFFKRGSALKTRDYN